MNLVSRPGSSTGQSKWVLTTRLWVRVLPGLPERIHTLPKRTLSSIICPHGGYGETVITGVCGTSITGSIPVSRPMKKLPVFAGSFFIAVISTRIEYHPSLFLARSL